MPLLFQTVGRGFSRKFVWVILQVAAIGYFSPVTVIGETLRAASPSQDGEPADQEEEREGVRFFWCGSNGAPERISVWTTRQCAGICGRVSG